MEMMTGIEILTERAIKNSLLLGPPVRSAALEGVDVLAATTVSRDRAGRTIRREPSR
jgi:hypothetical protein